MYNVLINVGTCVGHELVIVPQFVRWMLDIRLRIYIGTVTCCVGVSYLYSIHCTVYTVQYTLLTVHFHFSIHDRYIFNRTVLR